MKNILIILLNIALLSACKNSEKKDFVTLSGKIENNKDSIIRIFNRQGLVKEFAINKDGSFQDTLKVKETAIYNFTTESNRNVPIFLKNGYNISIKGEASDFLEYVDFQEKLKQIKNTNDSILNSYQNLDSTLFVNVSAQNEQLISYFENTYAKNQVMGKGKPSPKFENYRF